jgi:hypothetical protein
MLPRLSEERTTHLSSQKRAVTAAVRARNALETEVPTPMHVRAECTACTCPGAGRALQIIVAVPEAVTLYLCDPSRVSVALPAGPNVRTASIVNVPSLEPLVLDAAREALIV